MSRSPAASDAPKRSAIDRGRIVAAALRQIDERGLRRFSMRQLANELGVSSGAPYWHARDTDEVLEWVIDAVLADVQASTDDGSPPLDRAAALVRRLRRALLAHPNTVDLLFTGVAFAPRMASLGSEIIDDLHRAGLGPDEAAELFATLMTYLMGSLTVMRWVGTIPDPAGWASLLETTRQGLRSSDEHGEAGGVFAAHLLGLADEQVFDRGLEALLFSARPTAR